MAPSFAAVLVDLHKYFGHGLQAVALLVLLGVALQVKIPLKRIAPVLLDIEFTLGLLMWLLEKRHVSLLHPLCMLAAVALAHIAAKQEKRHVVLGLWVGVLALLVLGMLIAQGKVAPGVWVV